MLRFAQIITVVVVAVISLTSCHSNKATMPGGYSKREYSEKKEYYAKKFGVDLDRESNIRLYEAIDSWIGVKYKYASCTRDGIDCSCLVNAIYREAYSCNTPRDTKALCEQIKKVDRDELKEGDLVFFKMSGSKINHVGVYLSQQKFVHAATKGGVMISSLEEEHFRKAFKIAGRLKCS